MFGCGGSGIEGYVNEPITITANNPEEGQDVDYFWSLAEQPDGSLINSGDLLASDYGQEMVFTPDYPGDYLIEVVISQYGDEISNQTFSFSILDASDKQSSDNKSEEENEDWLNEEIDDSLQQEMVQSEEDTITEKPNQTEEVDVLDGKSMSDKDRVGLAAMGKMALEKKVKPVINLVEPAKTSVEIKQPKKLASIAERTDRFTIQITSKKMLKDAQLFSQNLIEKGYDSYIQKVVFNSQEIWYRVRVGSYDNYNSAKTAADALSSTLGMPTWVDFVRKEQ
ncbi:MAG: SPOR domain-containing protein [Candidatus Neomarinimicrobiota bacterium]